MWFWPNWIWWSHHYPWLVVSIQFLSKLWYQCQLTEIERWKVNTNEHRSCPMGRKNIFQFQLHTYPLTHLVFHFYVLGSSCFCFKPQCHPASMTNCIWNTHYANWPPVWLRQYLYLPIQSHISAVFVAWAHDIIWKNKWLLEQKLTITMGLCYTGFLEICFVPLIIYLLDKGLGSRNLPKSPH